MPVGSYGPGENYDYQLTIGELLATPLLNSPDREIVYGDRSRFTYRSLNERIHRLAGALSALDAGCGDTIAVIDYDSHRYLECFFAIPMMGGVIQTVNWRLSADQVLYTLQHAGATAIIVHADFLPLLETIHGQLRHVDKVILITEDGVRPDTRIPISGEYESLLQEASPRFPFPDLDENTKATTFYTTGTTGNPKGVYYSHRQIMLHTLAIGLVSAGYNTICRFRSDDVYMPLTPMFHVHAWGYPYLSTLLGVKQVYLGQYDPAEAIDTIKREGVTFSHCVPTVLQMVLNAAHEQEADLSGWKVIIGGSQLPKGLAREARECGIDLHAGYGMSETGPIITLATPMEDRLDAGEEETLDIITKTGKPLPLVQLEVVDSQDRPLPHDGESTGEVVMRAPWLTQSYYNSPDKTQELWGSGWLHSGDVGYIDGEGYLQITDRIKDVIKSGGEWISSLDLENLMSQHEAVMESAAIGIPDEKWGERPLLLVVLKPDFLGKVSSEDLRAYMKDFAEAGKLPRYAVPDHYAFVDAIAKTSVGKIDKKVLRQNWEEYLESGEGGER